MKVPKRRPKTRAVGGKPGVSNQVRMRTGPRATDVHDIVFYVAPDGTMPARDYLCTLPVALAARFRVVAAAVAAAPPTRFAGGGMWEAMHGDMAGWFEIRIDAAPNRTHYRVFCIVDTQAQGAERPYLVLVDGRTKPFRTTLTDRDYAAVKELGDLYWATQPRPVG